MTFAGMNDFTGIIFSHLVLSNNLINRIRKGISIILLNCTKVSDIKSQN
jgi:hypothetical protein